MDFYGASSHCNRSLLHSDTWSWFGANQSLLLHLNVACLAEKQQTPILSNWLESTIYYTRLAWIHDLLHSIGLNPRSTTQLAWIHNLLHSIGLNPRSTTLDWLESTIYYTRLAWIHDLLHSIGLNPRSTTLDWLESTIYYSIGLNLQSTTLDCLESTIYYTRLAWIHDLPHSIGLNPRSTTLDWLESTIYYTRLAWIHDLLHSNMPTITPPMQLYPLKYMKL